MIQKVLLISGKKQSGKSSTRNYILGRRCVDNGVWDRFNISKKGELMVPVEGKDHLECLDLNQRSPEFLRYAMIKIWPITKNYSIANSLKYIAIDLFGLDYEHCFGQEEDKNKETEVRWSDVSFALPPRTVGIIKQEGKFNDFLTGRQFLETFGTDVCRKINTKCWAQNIKNEIEAENFPYCIIDDVRDPSEIKVLDDGSFDIIKIRLKRKPCPSTSQLEVALDKHDDLFDLVVPDGVSIVEKQELIVDFISKEWL